MEIIMKNIIELMICKTFGFKSSENEIAATDPHRGLRRQNKCTTKIAAMIILFHKETIFIAI